jgi:hypothetical protein
MGDIGSGYGSKHFLLRYLAREYRHYLWFCTERATGLFLNQNWIMNGYIIRKGAQKSTMNMLV